MSIRKRPLTCHCLLVETPASGLVLVDTGLGQRDAAAVYRLGGLFPWLARPVADPEVSALARIRALGFDPRDVRHVVLTHMDLDHIGGLADFPGAEVHVHAAELEAATQRATFRARRRYLPALWQHQPVVRSYSLEGEPWFGFGAVRALAGLPDDLLLIPLFGHTMGHCGVAVRDERGWMLHAGDAYFQASEIAGPERAVDAGIDLFQRLIGVDRRMTLHNQARLRALRAQHPDVRVFSAHDPHELAAMQTAAAVGNR